MQMIKTTSLKKEQKELLVFLLVAFGLTFLMMIPWGIAYYSGKEAANNASQAFYPAAGVILAKMMYERDNPLLPKRFFMGFLILTGISILVSLLAFSLPEHMASTGSTVGAIVASVGMFVSAALYFSENQEKRSAYGMTGKNWGLSIRLAILFLILVLASNALFELATGNVATGGIRDMILSHPPEQRPYFIFGLLFQLVLLSSVLVFAEEYGWRYFLQPRLQQKFGMIKGVLLVGVLWELWHLPMVLFTFSHSEPLVPLAQVLVLRYVHTILLAIFIGYVYLKTHNIWAAIAVHLLNNVFASFGSTWPSNEKEGWMMLGGWILIHTALFLPFLFSKVFRKQSTT